MTVVTTSPRPVDHELIVLPDHIAATLARLRRLDEIPALFGVTPAAVKLWRGRSLARAPHDPLPLNALPRPVVLPRALARLVRDPVWLLEDLEEWGRQTGRLDLDNRPVRLNPPGRPRRDLRP